MLDALELKATPPHARGKGFAVGALVYEATLVAKERVLGDVAWLEHAGSWRP